MRDMISNFGVRVKREKDNVLLYIVATIGAINIALGYYFML